jgi:hypothetical protein
MTVGCAIVLLHVQVAHQSVRLVSKFSLYLIASSIDDTGCRGSFTAKEAPSIALRSRQYCNCSSTIYAHNFFVGLLFY